MDEGCKTCEECRFFKPWEQLFDDEPPFDDGMCFALPPKPNMIKAAYICEMGNDDEREELEGIEITPGGWMRPIVEKKDRACRFFEPK